MDKQTIERMLEKQDRCVECGKNCMLEIHHRIFRSEGLTRLHWFLGKFDKFWGINDRQNLVVLCREHHEKIHSGDRALREKYRNSFTCPTTGFNMPFEKGFGYKKF